METLWSRSVDKRLPDALIISCLILCFTAALWRSSDCCTCICRLHSCYLLCCTGFPHIGDEEFEPVWSIKPLFELLTAAMKTRHRFQHNLVNVASIVDQKNKIKAQLQPGSYSHPGYSDGAHFIAVGLRCSDDLRHKDSETHS